MTTVPGFSSRDTTSTVRQLPMRDEASMSNEPGWSNSESDHESRTTTTEVPVQVEVSEDDGAETETVARRKAARKSAK